LPQIPIFLGGIGYFSACYKNLHLDQSKGYSQSIYKLILLTTIASNYP